MDSPYNHDLNWINTFMVISGLQADQIIERCMWLPLEDETILHFYMHTRRFPTDREAGFIADVGLNNFITIYNAGIIAA
jgi:hypothetical protein